MCRRDRTVTVHPAVGDFNGFQKKKATEFRINVTQKPSSVSAKVGENSVNPVSYTHLDVYKRQPVRMEFLLHSSG